VGTGHPQRDHSGEGFDRAGAAMSATEPYRVRLPGFITDDEVGLGDLVKRATSAVGFRPCDDCRRRAEALNRKLVFSKRGRS
jgi:hypothetical protein